MNQTEYPFLGELIELRHDIHAYPEPAFQEVRTAGRVAETLAACGIEVFRGLAKTGVVGVLRGRRGPGPMIGLRADMDALPIHEKNQLEYRSCNDGFMHACGHDGHTVMLLGAARALAVDADFSGTVCFIFQPAEETEGGAKVMIEHGLFDQFPVERVFGLHNWPGLPEGRMAMMPGPMMAGTCTFEINMRGRGCHAAMPDQGNDIVLAGAQLVSALQSIVSRNLHPCDPAVVSVTQFHAGSAWNVLPDDAVLRGTIRTFEDKVLMKVEQTMAKLCRGIGSAFGVAVDVRFHERYPSMVNTPAETTICLDVARRLLGEDKVAIAEKPSMGAEDFAFMLREKPGCYVWLGSGSADKKAGLHSPEYDFNDRIIHIGISYWCALVNRMLGQSLP